MCVSGRAVGFPASAEPAAAPRPHPPGAGRGGAPRRQPCRSAWRLRVSSPCSSSRATAAGACPPIERFSACSATCVITAWHSRSVSSAVDSLSVEATSTSVLALDTEKRRPGLAQQGVELLQRHLAGGQPGPQADGDGRAFQGPRRATSPRRPCPARCPAPRPCAGPGSPPAPTAPGACAPAVRRCRRIPPGYSICSATPPTPRASRWSNFSRPSSSRLRPSNSLDLRPSAMVRSMCCSASALWPW